LQATPFAQSKAHHIDKKGTEKSIDRKLYAFIFRNFAKQHIEILLIVVPLHHHSFPYRFSYLTEFMINVSFINMA